MTDGPGVTEQTAPPAPVTEADVAGGPAPAADQPVKGLDRRRSPLGFLTSPGLAWVVAILAIAFAVFALVQRSAAQDELAELRAAERTRAEVAREANTVALRLTTFKGEEIEEWYAQMRDAATGDFADQIGQVFNQQTRDTLRDIGVVSVGEMQDLFVQDVDGNDARAFALVKQTYINAGTPDPVEDHQRMDIRLKRVDGRWLASEVVVLGPNGVIAPSDGGQSAPTVPNDEGDQ